MDDGVTIGFCKFVVDNEPYCVWDGNLPELNLSYINQIQPDYYEHLATVHGEDLEGGEPQYAALALRTAYSQGSETLFALIGATLQCPNFIPGWMLKYQNKNLKSVVYKIENSQPLLSAFPVDSFSWDSIADIILRFSSEDISLANKTRRNFARLWHRLAIDFLDEGAQNEYNSIKHGLRVGIGSWFLGFAIEEIPGVPAPPESMHVVNQSKHGANFYTAEKISDAKEYRHHTKLIYNRRNWEPEAYVSALNLISLSITNILGYLRSINGVDPSTIKLGYYEEDSLYEKPWKNISKSAFKNTPHIYEDMIAPFSKEEILSIYTQKP